MRVPARACACLQVERQIALDFRVDKAEVEVGGAQTPAWEWMADVAPTPNVQPRVYSRAPALV